MATLEKQRQKNPGRGSPSRAERNIAWIEKYCRIPDGDGVGKPLILADFLKDDLRAIYDNPRGTRRAIISRARKNAKTLLCTLIVLLHLCGPEAKSKPNSQLYSTAQSREQAALLFNYAAKIIRLSEELHAVVSIGETAKRLECKKLGIVYKALSADATTAYGLNPALVIHDELGQVRGPRFELYDALETSTGAQGEPLSIVISTQARTDNDLLSMLIDRAATGENPRVVLRFNYAPDDLDTFSVEAIRAANPAFDHFMNKDEVLAMAADAKSMPARQSEYENLVLNRRCESTSPFISHATWKSCSAPVKEFEPDLPLYGGLDLSEVNDLTAFVLIGRIDGVWHVKPTFWLPEDGLYDKARKDRVQYDVWRDQGYLLTAPGKSVDYEYVAQYLARDFERYNIRKVAFDRWNMKHLRPWLIKAGFDEAFIDVHFVEMGQGTQSMSPALRDLEAEILNGRIAHGGHPVLTMCAANAVTEGKDSSNRKLSKNKSTGRIDGMVALAMAMGAAPTDGEEQVITSPWEDENYRLQVV